MLKIRGSFPNYAAGTLYRTGPGRSRIENCTLNGNSKTHHISHWFDGLAHAHKFDIRPSTSLDNSATVVYTSRRQSEAFEEIIRQKGWRSSISFAQKIDPCVGIFAKLASVFEPRGWNNSVVIAANVPGLGDKRQAPPSPPRTPPEDPNYLPSHGHKKKVENIWVFTDNSNLQQLDPSSLEPIGEVDQTSLHPDLKGPLSCAHTQRDPKTGDYFNYNLDLGQSHTYRVFKTGAATGKTSILASFTSPDLPPAYMHSFFLTENHVVLAIQTAHFTWNGLSIVWHKNIVDSIQPVDPNVPWQWVIIDRKFDRGIVGRFTTPAGFFFHSSNAFERQIPNPKQYQEREGGDDESDFITEFNFDLIMYENSDIMHAFYYDIILDRNNAMQDFWLKDDRYKTNCRPRFTRYTYRLPSSALPTTPCKLLTAKTKPQIPVGKAKESISILSPHVGELPTISPARLTKRARYLYSLPSRGFSTSFDCIAKTDLDMQEVLMWSGGRGQSPGEPIFIPNPEGTDEDDGVILSVVLDGEASTSYLVCLDGTTMEEMGRAEMDFAVAIGFHGVHERGAQ